jgi:hypothetical protein
MIICPECQHENRDEATFCSKCGCSLAAPSAAEPLPPEAAPEPTETLVTPMESGQEGDTGPLTPPPPLFAPLPEGAILDGGRYLVLEDQSSGPELNVYLIESKEPRLKCPNPNCLSQENIPGEEYCAECGASLEGVSPTYPHFLMKESLESTTSFIRRSICITSPLKTIAKGRMGETRSSSSISTWPTSSPRRGRPTLPLNGTPRIFRC